jgi:hypothetical protein
MSAGTKGTKMAKTADPPKTYSIPTFGKLFFDLGRNASYAAAARGDFPVVQIGKIKRVPAIAGERMLAEATPTKK